MRSRFDSTSLQILECLKRHGGVSAEELAETCDLSIGNASTLLLKLFRFGQVEREKVQRGKVPVDRDEKVFRPKYLYLYSITQNGKDRMQYMAQRSEERNR